MATLFGLRVVRIKRCGGSDFGGATVLVARSGDPVSFNTTVGGGVLLKDKRLSWLKTSYPLSIIKRTCPLSKKSKTLAINGI